MVPSGSISMSHQDSTTWACPLPVAWTCKVCWAGELLTALLKSTLQRKQDVRKLSFFLFCELKHHTLKKMYDNCSHDLTLPVIYSHAYLNPEYFMLMRKIGRHSKLFRDLVALQLCYCIKVWTSDLEIRA